MWHSINVSTQKPGIQLCRDVWGVIKEFAISKPGNCAICNVMPATVTLPHIDALEMATIPLNQVSPLYKVIWCCEICFIHKARDYRMSVHKDIQLYISEYAERKHAMQPNATPKSVKNAGVAATKQYIKQYSYITNFEMAKTYLTKWWKLIIYNIGYIYYVSAGENHRRHLDEAIMLYPGAVDHLQLLAQRYKIDMNTPTILFPENITELQSISFHAAVKQMNRITQIKNEFPDKIQYAKNISRQLMDKIVKMIETNMVKG